MSALTAKVKTPRGALAIGEQAKHSF